MGHLGGSCRYEILEFIMQNTRLKLLQEAENCIADAGDFDSEKVVEIRRNMKECVWKRSMREQNIHPSVPIEVMNSS